MAIAKGFKAEEKSSGFTAVRYLQGVAPVRILAVNPTKKELLELGMASEKTEEPVYATKVELNDSDVDMLRVTFIGSVQGSVINSEEDYKFRLTFNLYNAPNTNSDKSKAKIIDKYANTAWATSDEIKKKAIPMYKNGPAGIDPDYRVAMRGEEELLLFIKAFMCIPNSRRYVNGTWLPAENLEDCEISLTDVKKTILSGNVKEIRDAVMSLKENYVYAMLGAKITPENKVYQDVFTNKFLTCYANGRYDRLYKEVEDAKAMGRHPLTEFYMGPVQEFDLNGFFARLVQRNTETKPKQSDSPVNEDLPF